MCGIIGIFNHEHAAELASLGLFAEQHRGQESCGMAVSDGRFFRLRRKMGLVKEVFDSRHLERLRGHIAVGHVRYPTRGTSSEGNSQPHLVETLSGPAYALASNGDVVNYREIREDLEGKGVWFSSDNDGELLLKYIVYLVEKEGYAIIDAIRELMKKVRGAYSTILATPSKMYIFRDPYAIRPMVIGKTADGTMAAASESCALDILDPQWVEEVPPAGLIVFDENGIEKIDNDPQQYRTTGGCRHCIFEHIYFSRPDSFEFGGKVFEIRERIGALLAERDAGLDVDVVVPVPDSANFMALGYAKSTGLPFEMGLIRNHYVGRTFIKPQQTIRDESVKQKFNTLPQFFEGKKIVLVDDSIVRGTTVRKIVRLIKSRGAAKVHLRIGSPPVKHSCFYGIDTPTREELIANNMTVDQITEYLGVDSLHYLPLEDLRRAVKKPENFCYACFDGYYPV